eukprot:c20502_g1_i2.p1 GENE.c20502_g1_i2~~c20502_g1_i2.p1  ORF type:complete len:297 (+),score=53.84 c20502_g1_i2:563-1453(+)
MFGSPAFVALFRIAIPVIDLFAVLICAEALRRHLARIKQAKNSSSFKLLMLLGSAIQLCNSATRGVYFAIGPLGSTSRITFAAHMILVPHIIGMDLVSTLISVSLLMQWGAFGQRSDQFVRMSQVLCAILSIAVMLALWILGYEKATNRLNLNLTVFAVHILALGLLFICGVSFIVLGSRFVRQLRGPSQLVIERDSARLRAIRKAVMWIALSGLSILLEIVSMALSLSPLFYSPWAHYFIFLGIMGATCLTGFSHALAFRPVGEFSGSILALAKGVRDKLRVSGDFSSPRSHVEV